MTEVSAWIAEDAATEAVTNLMNLTRRGGSDFSDPTCVFKALDLGISLGSAAKTAAMLDVDNRIMYRVGTAAMKIGLLPEATIIVGIPVSAKGKSIYFDRAK